MPASIADAAALPVASLPMLPCQPACIQQEPAPAKTPSIAQLLYSSLAWRETDSAVPYEPSPFSEPHDLRFLAVHSPTRAELLTSSAVPLAVKRTFTPSSLVLAEQDLRSFVLASFPENPPVPMDHGTVGLCLQFANRQPRPPAAPLPAPVKFLPLREDPILPSAANWAPLTSLHR